MDIEKCRVLVRAVQLGSMSATSGELDYTPSGISYIIDTVEKELGFKIIERNQTGITLTHAGVKCMPLLESLIDADDNLQRIARVIRKDIGGEITIGTFPSIGRLILPDIIQEYLKAHPNVIINIAEGINEQLEQMINRKEVDFCICSVQKPGYDWIPLKYDSMVCVLSPDNELAKKDVLSAGDLEREKFIMTEYGRGTDLKELLKNLHLDPNIISYTLENSTAYAMVKRNMGITIVNELSTIGTTDGLIIKQLNPPQRIVEGVLIKNLQHSSQIIKDFIGFMKPYF